MKTHHALKLVSADLVTVQDNVEHLELLTDSGIIHARFHDAGSDNAVIWVGGAGGGLDGPAAGLYPRLAERLIAEDISSFRVDYRYPRELEESIMDTTLACEYIKRRGIKNIVLVGHSAGGAVVITTGALQKNVVGVAALSSQTYGTSLVDQISPRPLLLIHGTEDEILPDICSKDLYNRALEPKEILLYPGCRHGLDECMDILDSDLEEWIIEIFS